MFILIVEEVGIDPTFQIDFGDGFIFTFDADELKAVSDTQDKDSVLNEEGINLLQSLSNQSKVKGQMK